MKFRDREKQRLVKIKGQLFSEGASGSGIYNGKPRDFCIGDGFSSDNLHSSMRSRALEYFRKRKIPWHDGINVEGELLPSNHLCCSQCSCVNAWFPFIAQPSLLKNVLEDIGYPVKEVLPLEADLLPEDENRPFVSFEWIGIENYLHETRFGRVVQASKRTRGEGFTSADFAFRFRREDDQIQIVLGEWKYTEEYSKGKNIRISDSDTDRLAIYQPELSRQDCQIRLPEEIELDSLFYDPFDQLMRLQLLASAMEREHEMEAAVVSVLHVAPRANTELMRRITSPALESIGNDIHRVWNRLVTNDRFRGLYTEDLLPVLVNNSPDPAWTDYMKARYGGME